MEYGVGGGGGGGGSRRVGGKGLGRSEREKERTKLRERQRRSITTKIFAGLRKHGGYNLPPRADINDVLRVALREAGWVVEPDGTTHRSQKGPLRCAACGATCGDNVALSCPSVSAGDGDPLTAISLPAMHPRPDGPDMGLSESNGPWAFLEIGPLALMSCASSGEA